MNSLRIGFAYPGDLAAPTGGYGYDRRIMRELAALDCLVTPIALPASFPDPSADDIEAAGRLLRRTNCEALLIDGLACGALPADLVVTLAPRPIALVHHPLFLETGLAPDRAAILRESEGAALAEAAAVVATSNMTADILTREFGVARERMFVATPGVDEAPRAPGSSDGIVRLLAVGSVIPRKGYDDMIRALAGVIDSDNAERASREKPASTFSQRAPDAAWRLSIVGALDFDPSCARALEKLIAEFGLSAQVALEGALPADAVATRYAAADAFVTSSHFEGYGMAIAEAVARGLPIVATNEAAAAGAAPAEAMLTCPAGNIAALREALGRIVGDAALRARFGAHAWAAARTQPRWRDAAQAMLHAIRFAVERAR